MALSGINELNIVKSSYREDVCLWDTDKESPPLYQYLTERKFYITYIHTDIFFLLKYIFIIYVFINSHACCQIWKISFCIY